MKKLKVLSIDDSKAVQLFLADCVKEVSSEFITLPDGGEAIKFMSQTPAPQFDIIFLDWEMPVKTGPEVLAEFRKLGVKAPIVMLTSKNNADEIAHLLAQGASEYIMKPFTKDIILDKITYVMEGGF